MSHILAKNDKSARSPTVGGFQSDSPHTRYNYDGVFFSNFTALRNFLKTNSPNHHFRWVKFWSRTTILRDRQRWSDCSPIFDHYNYDGVSFSNCTALRHFPETNLPNRHFRRVSFWQKRQFFAIAIGGRFSARFSPTAITRVFAFTILLRCGTF